ncbi:hypothetical protein BGX38DRAFT_1267506 [Terfezia claveryi]|nr:hypothetical protein BGX38DRAFT_1267506 [Terfezia claveryi]
MVDPISAIGLAASVGSIIQLTGQVATMFSDYVSAVKGAGESVDRLKQELTAVLEVLKEISDLTIHGVTLNPAVMASLTECENTLQQMLEKITQFKLKPKQNAVTSLSIRQKIKWPFREKRILGWIEILEVHKTTISLHLQQQTLVGVTKIESNVKRVEEVQQRTEHEEKRRQLIEWLSPLPYNIKQSQTSSRRQKGTGDWLFEQYAYESWEKGQANALWINGIPGSGKTFLTSNIIDRLIKNLPNGQYALAYCYCDFTENAASVPLNIIRTLLVQLLGEWNADCDEQFPDLFSMLRLGQGPPASIQALVELTERCLGLGSGEAFIVIDALDECTNRVDLLEYLCAIIPDKRIHMLVTGRHEQDIIEKFGTLFHTISLADESSELLKDMQHHLAEELKTPKWSHLHHPKNSAMKAELEETLFKDSERNMFRWLQCQLDTLAKHKSNSTLRRALKNLPPDLFRAYERILLGIDAECTELAYKTLLWLATSIRRMTMDELVEALAIFEGQRSLDHEATVNDALHLVRICGSLVEYDEDLDIVNLTHATVKDFLYWDGLRSNPRLSCYALEYGTANSTLAKLTLTYLLLDDFSDGPCETFDELDSRMSDYPLYQYCAEAYPTFVNAKEDEGVFEQMWTLFYDRLPQFRSYQQIRHYLWVRNWYIFQRDHWNVIQRFTPLYYTIADSMQWPARKILEKRPELLEEEIPTRGTPLAMATRDSNLTMVKLFMSLGADVNFNAYIPNMRSPLNTAALLGDDQIFNMLLDGGADMSARGVNRAHSIHEAAQGSLGILALLLQRGIDPALTCGLGSTPLHYAVTGGTRCLPQIRMLVEAPYHADIFAYNNVNETPLHIALSLRCLPMLDYLMSHADDLSPLGENEASTLTLEDVTWAEAMPWYPKLRASLASRERRTFKEWDVCLIDLLQLRLSLSKRMQLPQARVQRIMDHAALWTKVTIARHKLVTITQDDERKPYLSILIKRPLRRLVFRFRSHDQGWSDQGHLHGGYSSSFTWFEACILTPRRLETDIPPRLLQRNVHASSTFRKHTVILDFNDPSPGVKQWLEMFHAGDTLEIYGMALYPGWINFVDYVEVDVFCA